jgi:hypothetical protein
MLCDLGLEPATLAEYAVDGVRSVAFPGEMNAGSRQEDAPSKS